MDARERAAFDLYVWRQRDGQNYFTVQLYDLIEKADNNNKVRLAQAFPVEVVTYLEWQDSPTEEAFYRKYKLGKFMA